MAVDDHSPSLSPKLERSPPRTLQKQRLEPSRYPVIQGYFVRGPSEKKKRPRKRGIVPFERARRPKRTSGKVRTSGNNIFYRAFFLKTRLLFRFAVCGPARFQNLSEAATRTLSSTCGPFHIYGCGRAPAIEVDGHRLYPCVAELWICLVHLGTLRGRASGTPGDDFPPIVEILQNCPAAAESSTQGGVKASEDLVHLVWTVRPLPILCPWRTDIFCSHEHVVEARLTRSRPHPTRRRSSSG
jgi:hypothetical protein